MKKQQIILVGGGGHAKVIIDAIQAGEKWEIVGVIDAQLPLGSKIADIEIIGRDEDILKIYQKGITHAFISVGSVESTSVRRKLCLNLKEIGFKLPVIIHPSAQVSSFVTIAEGTFISMGAIIQSGSVIKENAIINTGAIVDHDCCIGQFAHLAPGVRLSGEVVVGDDTLIGTGTSVKQNMIIGHHCIIGAGSAVVSHIPDNSKAYGNPCRIHPS